MEHTSTRESRLLGFQAVCSFNKYWLSVYYVPGSVLGSGERAINQKRLGLIFTELLSAGSTDDKQVNSRGRSFQGVMKGEKQTDET